MDSMHLLIGNIKLTVSEAMKQIDENSCGILFLVDDKNRILGSISDGDVRRFLLSGGQMTDSAIEAVNSNPKVAKSREQAASFFHVRDYKAVPIVNEFGEIIDVYIGSSDVEQKIYSSIRLPVVINAGGKGTRLDPYTKILPKPLIPVGEMPIIEHILKEYMAYDCSVFHIILNYKKELIKAYFSEIEEAYDITWYEEKKPLGTGGGLSLLKGKINTTFFFANCDALLTVDYSEILDFHKKNGNIITMICAYKNINIPYGVVDIGNNGIIENLHEKPLMSFLTNTGIYLVEPEVINDIENGVSMGFPDICEMEMKKGKNVAAFPVSESSWMDMGQFPELESMRKKLYGE